MNWKTQLRHYYGDYRLTLSGDISLVPTGNVRYVWSPEVRQQIETWRTTLDEQFPFLKISLKEGIKECEITIFSFSSACADEEFLELFCDYLRRLSDIIRTEENVSVVMNFSGIFFAYREAQHFRILNKRDDIQYKIVEKKPRTAFDCIIRSSYMRIGLTVLLVIAVLQCAWNEIQADEVVGRLM